jgi:transcriptional regulator with XRE-family HTH domain
MSDLYLVLRRRLEDVTDWVDLGTATLKNARKAQGLSYEAMGRNLNVAAKTYERYEKAGRVPRHLLPAVADVLDLEIDWPKRGIVTVAAPPESDDARLEAIVSELRDLREIASAILERVEQREGEDEDGQTA